MKYFPILGLFTQTCLSLKMFQKNSRVSLPVAKIAVFSAQFGGRDHIEMLKGSVFSWSERRSSNIKSLVEDHLSEGTQMVLFTDMINVTHRNKSVWSFDTSPHYKDFCQEHGNTLCQNSGKRLSPVLYSILRSKFYKTRFMIQNTDYDFIVWMDGKFLMTNKNLGVTLNQLFDEDTDMLVVSHPDRKTVQSEVLPACHRAAVMLKLSSDASICKRALQLMDGYVKEGFIDDGRTPLLDSSMYVLRPKRRNVKEMMQNWWFEVQRGLPRDQVSLPVMIQKYNVSVKIIQNQCTVLGKDCLNPGRHH